MRISQFKSGPGTIKIHFNAEPYQEKIWMRISSVVDLDPHHFVKPDNNPKPDHHKSKKLNPDQSQNTGFGSASK
jgi:hypothetical protein